MIRAFGRVRLHDLGSFADQYRGNGDLTPLFRIEDPLRVVIYEYMGGDSGR